MTSAAALCLYLLMFCPMDVIPPSAPPLAHQEGFWAIYRKGADGTESAQTYLNGDECSLDSALLRDVGQGSICYPLL